MPRRPIKKKRTLLPDPVYNSVSVHLLINRVLKSGKKSIAYRIVYDTLREVGEATQKNPIEVFEKILDQVTPRVAVKPRRRGGAVQMVPRVLRSGEQSKNMAIRWMLEGCAKQSGKPMVTKLKNEMLEAFKKNGYAMRKREELYKLAVNNAMYAKRPQAILNAVNQAGSLAILKGVRRFASEVDPTLNKTHGSSLSLSGRDETASVRMFNSVTVGHRGCYMVTRVDFDLCLSLGTKSTVGRAE